MSARILKMFRIFSNLFDQLHVGKKGQECGEIGIADLIKTHLKKLI